MEEIFQVVYEFLFPLNWTHRNHLHVHSHFLSFLFQMNKKDISTRLDSHISDIIWPPKNTMEKYSLSSLTCSHTNHYTKHAWNAGDAEINKTQCLLFASTPNGALEWINKLWSNHTIEYYWAMEMNCLWLHATIWMTFMDVMIKKATYKTVHIISGLFQNFQKWS